MVNCSDSCCGRQVGCAVHFMSVKTCELTGKRFLTRCQDKCSMHSAQLQRMMHKICWLGLSGSINDYGNPRYQSLWYNCCS